MHWLLLISLAAVLFLVSPSHGVIISLTSKRCPSRVLKGGRVRIRSKGRVMRYTCLRGYQLLGNRYSTCIRGRWDSPAPVCINDGCDSFNVVNGQVLETYRGAFATVHCDPGYLLVGNQGLYCNGAVWNDTLPICREIGGVAKKECDFESEDICGWTHDANQDFNWKRQNFATPSGYAGTGPSFDHTLGRGLNGHYMYLESSSPRLENDTARLFSPVFRKPSNERSCFIFWYHMFGVTTGTLNVYFHGKDSELLFTKSGDQGDQWHQAVLPLPLINSNFQIMIEGVRGAGYEGDIAIDDVKLAMGDECSVFIENSSPRVTNDDVSKPSEDSSCENRCFNSTTNPSLCECTPDCITKNTCCPDYLQSCVPVTEASEWPSSSEMEISTMDDISSTVTFAPKTISTLILKPNTISTTLKETDIRSKTFRMNKTKALNTPLSSKHFSTTVPIIVFSSTRKSQSSTSSGDFLFKTTTPQNITSLAHQNKYSSTKNISGSTGSTTKHFSGTFFTSTVPSKFKTTFSIYVPERTSKIKNQSELSTQSSNASFAKSSSKPSSHLRSVEHTTVHSTYSKKTKQPFTFFPVIWKRNNSLSTKQISTTPSYQRSTLVELTSSSTVNQISTGKILTSTKSFVTDKPRNDRKLTFSSTYKTSSTPTEKTRTDRKGTIFSTDKTSSAPTEKTRTDRKGTIFSTDKTSSAPTENTRTDKKGTFYSSDKTLFTPTYPRNTVYTKPTKKSLFSYTSSSMKTQKIIFNTPPPFVFYRTPKPTTFPQFTESLPNITGGTSIKYYTSPLYPKLLKNSTKKELKSRNDVLHHGWNKVNSNVIFVTTSRSKSNHDLPTLKPTSTTPESHSTSRNLHSTVLSLDYENTTENKQNSNYKPINRDSPYNDSIKRSSPSNEAERIFVWVCFMFLVLSTVLISVCVVRRRRRGNRRTDEDDELDIRFLSSDEMLDFTLSRLDTSEERTL